MSVDEILVKELAKRAENRKGSMKANSDQQKSQVVFAPVELPLGKLWFVDWNHPAASRFKPVNA